MRKAEEEREERERERERERDDNIKLIHHLILLLADLVIWGQPAHKVISLYAFAKKDDLNELFQNLDHFYN